MPAQTRRPETATLGGGCFWCLEAVFQQMKGVTRAQSGYSGGHQENPTYEQVCGARTGHAEVVQLEFDPAETSFREILEVFFAIHDPTTPNRQGNDVGPQYRSIILCHSPQQQHEAGEMIRALDAERIWEAPIVTEVVAFERFWPAEGYHDDYFRKNPRQPYCQVVVAPKVAKFRQKFALRLKPTL